MEHGLLRRYFAAFWIMGIVIETGMMLIKLSAV